MSISKSLSLGKELPLYVLFLYLFILVPVYGLIDVKPSVVLSLILLALVIKNKSFNFFKHYNLKIFLAFFLWSVFSSLFAGNYDYAIIAEGKFFVVLAFMLILSSYASKSLKHVFTLYYAYVFILIIWIVITLSSKNIDAANVGSQTSRDTEDSGLFIDPNTFGYYIFFGISFAFILFNTVKNTTFNKLKLILLVIFSFMMVLYTASRGTYVIFIISVTLNVIVLLLQSELKKGRKSLFYFLVLFILPLIYFNFFTLIEGTALETRFIYAQENETPRILHVWEAIRVGFDNPILGVGGGNYALVPRNFEQGLFSHNSFTEAFANYGIPGLLLFLSVYFNVLSDLAKAYKSPRVVDKRALLYLAIFFISFIAYNWFYVTYLTVEFMGAYIVAYTHLQHILSGRSIATQSHTRAHETE